MVGQSGNGRSSSDQSVPRADRQLPRPTTTTTTAAGGSQAAIGKSLSVLGFLTVIEVLPHGLFGGYLIVNPAGRPLEFHCTEPVKPSRAQQILYGPTLAPYLYAEQIGQALFAKARQTAPLILTDVLPALDLSSYVDVPVVLVPTECRGSDTPADGVLQTTHPGQLPVASTRVDGPQLPAPQLVTVQVAQQQIALAADREIDLQWLERDLGAVARRLDLAEPFARIRAAICEAQRIQRDDEGPRECDVVVKK